MFDLDIKAEEKKWLRSICAYMDRVNYEEDQLVIKDCSCVNMTGEILRER